MEKKYSVLMSLYKKENPEFLKLALDSMINQTIKPNEIVLVEDGPLTSDLYEVINEYKKKYSKVLKLVVNKENMGLGLALNKGLVHCSNNLVARMDTDDIAVKDRCEKQLKVFDSQPNVDIVGGNIAEFIDNADNIVAYRKVPSGDDKIKKYMKTRCPLNHMTVMLKKDAVLKSGNYLDWFWNEDYYLWIRMMLNNCIFENIEEVLVYARTGKDMYSRRGGKKYYNSEKKLQKYMLNNKIINYRTYFLNVSKRFVVQILLPNKIRGFVFKKIARR